MSANCSGYARRRHNSVGQRRLQIGGRGAERDLRVDLAVAYGAQALIEIGVRLIVLVDEAHAVEIEENDVRIPGKHLLGVNIERAGLTGRVGEVLAWMSANGP